VYHRTGLGGLPLALRLTEWLGLSPTDAVHCVSGRLEVHNMRTNIEIDDKLMKDALRYTGAKTKREAVELGLQRLVQLGKQVEVRKMRGKLQWEGDLDAMRTDK
jgi:Arc/MetJ family transcription regulator